MHARTRFARYHMAHARTRIARYHLPHARTRFARYHTAHTGVAMHTGNEGDATTLKFHTKTVVVVKLIVQFMAILKIHYNITAQNKRDWNLHLDEARFVFLYDNLSHMNEAFIIRKFDLDQ